MKRRTVINTALCTKEIIACLWKYVNLRLSRIYTHSLEPTSFLSEVM
jgi:hypothetical protein